METKVLIHSLFLFPQAEGQLSAKGEITFIHNGLKLAMPLGPDEVETIAAFVMQTSAVESLRSQLKAVLDKNSTSWPTV